MNAGHQRAATCDSTTVKTLDTRLRCMALLFAGVDYGDRSGDVDHLPESELNMEIFPDSTIIAEASDI